MIIINIIIIIIHQQVSLGKTISAIKNESDAVVEIRALQCNETKVGICQSLDLVDDSKQIYFTQTISVEVKCPEMKFDDFPFDEHVCDFLLKDLKLTEKRGIAKNNFQWKALETEDLGSELTSTDYDLHVDNVTVTGLNNSRIGFSVTMYRKPTVYIYTYFIPCFLMVVVSWVSFAVRVDAVPGRWGNLIVFQC